MSQDLLGPDYYDRMYAEDDRTYEEPLSSPYYPLYRRVVEFANTPETALVLEVGCGSGVLANMLVGAGLSYRGFDFSEIAVEKAKALVPETQFFIGDATDPAAYVGDYDTIVCCEVLEHIEADLQAISLWARGARCICSVPNFDYESHVRFFGSEKEVVARYSRLIDISRVEKVAKSPRAHTTWPEYLRRLRWSRNQPKRMLGMLGLNTFSWYGGWFVLIGRRR